MPKFYFQLTDGLCTVVDRSGHEFADAAAAREFATASRSAFSRQCENYNGESWLPWTVQVIDENGRQVFTLALQSTAW